MYALYRIFNHKTKEIITIYRIENRFKYERVKLLRVVDTQGILRDETLHTVSYEFYTPNNREDRVSILEGIRAYKRNTAKE